MKICAGCWFITNDSNLISQQQETDAAMFTVMVAKFVFRHPKERMWISGAHAQMDYISSQMDGHAEI